MNPQKTQRGFLLVTAVVLVVIVSALVGAMAFMFATGSQSGSDNLQSGQALFIAESGIERGIRQWSLNSAYPGESLPLANGSFIITTVSTDFLGNPLPAGQVRIRSAGTVSGGNGVRTAEVIARNSGSMLTNGSFTGNANGWVLSVPGGGGSMTYDGANGNPPGSLRALRSGGGGVRTMLADQTLAASFTTTAANSVFTVNFDYMADGNSQYQFFLVDSGGGIYQSANNNRSGAWASSAPTTITVPTAGTVITSFRVSIRLTGGANNARIDNVSLAGPGGSGAVSIRSWREVFQ